MVGESKKKRGKTNKADPGNSQLISPPAQGFFLLWHIKQDKTPWPGVAALSRHVLGKINPTNTQESTHRCARGAVHTNLHVHTHRLPVSTP